MAELADKRHFRVGAYDYHCVWSAGDGDPATYTLTVSRNISDSQPEPCFIVTIRSEKVHALIENRIYRDRIAEGVKKAIEEDPPD